MTYGLINTLRYEQVNSGALAFGALELTYQSSVLITDNSIQ